MRKLLIIISVFLIFAKLSDSQLYIQPIESPDPNSYGAFGFAVADVGDINKDGYDDVAISAPGENPVSAVYIYSIYDSTFIDTFYSPLYAKDFGVSLDGLGDVNNDNFNDLVIGTHHQNAYHSGIAYVYSGQSGDTLYSLTSPYPQNGGSFGQAVSNAGDVNNDGINDVLIGAPEEFPEDLNRAGRAYIFNGANGDTIRTLVSPNAQIGGYFGLTVCSIGDVNGDDFDDVAVGAPDESLPDFASAGRVYVFSGSSGDTLYTLQSLYPLAFLDFGQAIANAGDVNNDGINDIIVGSSESGKGINVSGRVYVFSGADGQPVYTISSPKPRSYGYFGVSVSGYTDINNDNHDDFLIGAYHEVSDTGVDLSGRVYIYNGINGDTLCSFDSPAPEYNGWFGFAVSNAGDVNNDAIEDFIVGAYGENGSGITAYGKAYIFSNSPYVITGLNQPPVQLNEFKLNSNYPNPFNPETLISYQLSAYKKVSLKIFDITGKEIETLVDAFQQAGDHNFTFNAQHLASGVYIYRLQAGKDIESRKMILLK